MQDKKCTKHCKDCITRIPIFNTLTDEQFDLINKDRCEVRFRAGETIFKQGTTMTHIMVITEGLVKVYIEGINHRNLILRLARPLTMIGGPGFFTDYKNHVTAMALEETATCFIDVNKITELIKLNQEFAMGLLKWTNSHTLSNFKKFIELTQKGMHGRIAGALLYLYNDVFKEQNGVIRVNRQDLADLTAMSKESAIRILKELKDENIITVDGNAIILNDLIKITRISEKG